MPKQIYINLPVSDLAQSTAFYEALGFTKNADFSNATASSMMWSEQIVVMLLTHDFYATFLRNKQIADTAATNGVLLALTMDTKEEVQAFADKAKENGGDYFQAETNVPADMMYSLEVQDPDGHTWEPVWMNAEFDPQANA